MGKINRIAITGASGVGKTTLAEYISKEFNYPFISASARDVWPQFKFENHQQALSECMRDTDLGLKYQEAILKNRHLALVNAKRFVTDRSPIDNYTYYMLQQGYKSIYDNEFFKALCEIDFGLIDAIIFIRVTDDMEIENNGRRIVNHSYQKMVDAMIEFSLMKAFKAQTFKKDLVMIDTWDLNERMDMIKELL